MEVARRFLIPIKADGVLSPQVHYGDPMTSICFTTHDDKFGRITFENLDALKVSRGEEMPYENDPTEKQQSYWWVSKIENSKWLNERYQYEMKYYGTSYEFGGNVNEMLTDFSHYVFNFHDQFVEAIARGVWFEKDEQDLFATPLQAGHPFLPLSDVTEIITAHTYTSQVRTNKKDREQLITDAAFCSQKMFEFALELEGRATVDHTVILAYRKGNLISSLRGYFGKEIAQFDGVVALDVVKPYIEKHIGEVYERRKKMGKA